MYPEPEAPDQQPRARLPRREIRREVKGSKDRLQEALSIVMRARYIHWDARHVDSLSKFVGRVAKLRRLHELHDAIVSVRRYCDQELPNSSKIKRVLYLAQRWADLGIHRELARIRKEQSS